MYKYIYDIPLRSLFECDVKSAIKVALQSIAIPNSAQNPTMVITLTKPTPYMRYKGWNFDLSSDPLRPKTEQNTTQDVE